MRECPKEWWIWREVTAPSLELLSCEGGEARLGWEVVAGSRLNLVRHEERYSPCRMIWEVWAWSGRWAVGGGRSPQNTGFLSVSLRVWASLVLVMMSLIPSRGLLIWIFSFLPSAHLSKGLSVCFILTKSQLFTSWICSIVFIPLISSLMISSHLRLCSIISSCFFRVSWCVVRLLVCDLASLCLLALFFNVGT